MKCHGARFKGLLAGFSVAAILGAALPALADDAAIQSKIEERFQKAKITAEGDVDVAVTNGAVLLTGGVATVAAQREAEKLARKEAKFVENHIVVMPEKRADADIKKDVLHALERNPHLGVFDSVEYGVDDGVVLLQGSVLRPLRKDEIETAVACIPGVREVRDEIGVQGLSPFDEGLRRQIYRQVYGHLDSSLAGRDGSNPPVRIVVDRGRVTLTGYVRSRVDQVLIGNIARSTLAFDVDNRIKVDGEPPAEDQKASPSPTLLI